MPMLPMFLLLFALATTASADTRTPGDPASATTPPSTRRIPNLAVMPLSGNSGVSAEDLRAVTSRLESELMRTGMFRVLERRNIDAILREQGFQQSGACNTSDCQVEVGQLLGVERIVSGELTHMGKLWSLTIRQVDVGTGALVVSHVLDIEGSLATVLRGGCPQMADIVSGRSKPVESRTVLQEKSATPWLWIAGGATILTGGVIAALVLTRNDESTTPPTPQRNVSITW